MNAPFGIIAYPSSLLSKYTSRIVESSVSGCTNFRCKWESKIINNINKFKLFNKVWIKFTFITNILKIILN